MVVRGIIAYLALATAFSCVFGTFGYFIGVSTGEANYVGWPAFGMVALLAFGTATAIAVLSVLMISLIEWVIGK